jgi:hypothetical protein
VPRRNRVTPLGELIADPARGLVFGNRGCLHDADGTIRRRFALRAWIACRLEFKGRRRELMQPGRYTELFFLDDATALAAGHRACAECRRRDYLALVDGWPGRPRAATFDAVLHRERLAEERPRMPLDELPEGAFVLRDGEPWLVREMALLRWTPGGYVDAQPRPRGASAAVITPLTLVAARARGWRPACVPFLHPSAGA